MLGWRKHKLESRSPGKQKTKKKQKKKIAGRNINNLRYADDTTHMVESKEELKSVLMQVKVVRSIPFLSFIEPIFA